MKIIKNTNKYFFPLKLKNNLKFTFVKIKAGTKTM